jgi:hypothetical protein
MRFAVKDCSPHQRLKSVKVWTLLLGIAFSLPSSFFANPPQSKELHFGVFAYQGIEKTTERYRPIADYLMVEDLARTLRLPPFKDHGIITLRAVIREYWPLVLATVLLICALVALLLLTLAKRQQAREFAKKQSLLIDTLQKSDERYENFFGQSIVGFFFMTLDEPISWDDAEDKDALVDYALTHHRLTKVNQAMLNHCAYCWQKTIPPISWWQWEFSVKMESLWI